MRLYDVSPVTFPAYTGATVGLRAAGEAEEAKSARDQFLREREKEAVSVRMQILTLENETLSS